MRRYDVGEYVKFTTNTGQIARGRVIEVFSARYLDIDNSATDDVLLIETDREPTRKPKPTRLFRFANDVPLCQKARHASGTSVPNQGNRRKVSR